MPTLFHITFQVYDGVSVAKITTVNSSCNTHTHTDTHTFARHDHFGLPSLANEVPINTFRWTESILAYRNNNTC